MDELRDKYLQGKLTEAEQNAFEENLSAEEKVELAHELGVRDEITKNQIRAKIERFEKHKRGKRINPTYIGIAASIVIAASIAFYFGRNQESLFDQYYTPYANYELTVVRGEEDLSNRQLAYAAYDGEDYETAISEFNKLDSLMAPDYFFRGVSYIQVVDFENALKDFRQVIDLKDQEYRTASQWYTALIYVKTENKEKAIPVLQKLSNGSSEFASVSTELLAKL